MTSRPRRPLVSAALYFLLVGSAPARADLATGLIPTTGQDLIFSTAPQNQPVTLKLRQNTLRYDLKIYAAKKLSGVRIMVEPFLDGNLKPIEPKLTIDGDETGMARDLNKGESRRLILEADLPRVGTYTTYLTPCYDGERRQPLTITVERIAPDLDIPDLFAGRAERWGGEEKETTSIPIGISEKNGYPFPLPAIQLYELAIKQEESKFVSQVNFAVQSVDQKMLPANGAIDRLEHRVIVNLSGFPEAGLYQGTLRFNIPGAAYVSKPFSVYIREPIWVLGICIFVGALISIILREYLARRRPRLVELKRASILARQLDVSKELASDSFSRQVVSSLQDQLIDIVQGLQLDTVPPETARNLLGVVDKKIDLMEEWLHLYGEASKAGVAGDQEPLKGLKEIATTLRNPEVDEATVGTARVTVASLWSHIQQAPPAMKALGSSRQSTEFRREAPVQASGWTGFMARMKQVSGRLLASDIVATAAIIAIACFLGVKALWVSNLTWGGWEDWVVALLWGLGLHQTSFAGIDALRSTVGK